MKTIDRITRLKSWYLTFLAILLLQISAVSNTQAYQVDLQNDTIYQIMVDRFHDGNPANNATGAAFRHQLDEELDMHHMKGGDWQGIIDKIDYIKNMGFTAIWISPIADPQLWRLPAPDGSQFPAAYHAYNAHDPNRANRYFGDIDPELSRQKLKELVDVAHANGIKVIIDVVPNHLGDFLQNGNYINPANVQPGTRFQPAAPFNNKSWYHMNGDTDFNLADSLSLIEKRNYLERTDLGSLDDIDYDNPDARNAMFGSIKAWYDYLEPDGARVDAAKSMFPSDINDLENLLDVPTFGENFDGSVDFVSMWLGDGGEWGMLDFPLFFAIRDGISYGNSFEADGGIAAVLAQDFKYNGQANRMVTFLDNHDRNRLLAETAGDLRKSKNAIAFLYTVRGVPVVFQGTEVEKGNHKGIYLTGGIQDSFNRWPMVEKDAAGNVLVDHFDANTQTKQLIGQLNQARKQYAALRYGTQREMWKAANLYAFSRRVDDGIGEGQEIIAVFSNTNNSQTQTIPLRTESSIPTGATLINVLNPAETITVSNNRDVTITVGDQSHKIYVYATDTQAPSTPGTLAVTGTSSSSASLSWAAASDSNGIGTYEIFRNGVHVNTSATLTVTDTGLKADTPYTYQVRSVDNQGNFSELSAAVVATTTEQMVKTATIYYKRGFDTPHIHYKQASGTWTTVPGVAMTPSNEFPGYSVSTEITLDATNQLEAVFNDGGSNWDNNNNNNYFFGHGASTIDAGIIKPGLPDGIDTTPPTVPQNLAAGNVDSNSITLNWSASTDAGGVANYQVFRNGFIVGRPSSTSFTDTGLMPNTTYSYSVLAVDNSGNASAASPSIDVQTTDQASTVSITFTVNGAPTQPGEDVYIIGNIPALGEWTVSNAQGPGDGSGYPIWTVQVDNLPPSTNVQFKAVVLKPLDPSNPGGPRDFANPVWEPGQDNNATTPASGNGSVSIDW